MKPLFSVGDLVRLSLDNKVYKVDCITPTTGAVPSDRYYFLVPGGRWPVAEVRTHNIPESAAKRLLSKLD